MTDHEEWERMAEIQMEQLKDPSEYKSEWESIIISDPEMDHGEVI